MLALAGHAVDCAADPWYRQLAHPCDAHLAHSALRIALVL